MSQKVMIICVVIVFLMGMVLIGCGIMKGWFVGKDVVVKKVQELVELVKFELIVKVSKIWLVNFGKGECCIGVCQGLVVVNGYVFVVVIIGGVYVIDLQIGKKVWMWELKKEKKKVRLCLFGGLGVGENLVVIGMLDGQVIVLDINDGSEKWCVCVLGEVIVVLVVVQGMVYVCSNDGCVIVFDVGNGIQKWFNLSELLVLIVCGNVLVVIGLGVLFIGKDEGVVVVLVQQDGCILWEQNLGNGEGCIELECMVDVDGVLVLEGNIFYVSSFKNQIMVIEGLIGCLLWVCDYGGVGGVVVLLGNVFVIDNKGGVFGLDKVSGVVMWLQIVLVCCLLIGLVLQGDYVVVGDYKGYVYWLQVFDGVMVVWVKSGGDVLLVQLVVVDGVLLVQNVDGKLIVFWLVN